MNFQASKIELAKLILSSENPQLISKIIGFFKNQQDDFWLEMSEEQQNDVRKGLAELDSGQKVKWTDLRDSV